MRVANSLLRVMKSVPLGEPTSFSRNSHFPSGLFEGFGLHSFRRANITLRQDVGGSAIEASKIAGHSGLAITGKYTKVQSRRQDELTRAIQDRIEEVRKKQEKNAQLPEAGEA